MFWFISVTPLILRPFLCLLPSVPHSLLLWSSFYLSPSPSVSLCLPLSPSVSLCLPLSSSVSLSLQITQATQLLYLVHRAILLLFINFISCKLNHFKRSRYPVTNTSQNNIYYIYTLINFCGTDTGELQRIEITLLI